MDYLFHTIKYYEEWIGQKGVLTESDSHGKTDILFMECEQCNVAQEGYSDVFDIYMLNMDNILTISYGNKAKSLINRIKSSISLETNVTDIIAIIETIYKTKGSDTIKYSYSPKQYIESEASLLGENNYDKYVKFFRKMNPKCTEYDWVKDYFMESIEQNSLYGIIKKHKMVCCVDNPPVPFCKSSIAEIGVNTLPNHRGKGYAFNVCNAMINDIVAKGMCPIWSTTVSNIASQKLATKLGFVKLANVYTFTL